MGEKKAVFKIKKRAAFKEGTKRNLKAQSHPELHEVSDSTVSLEATQNSAGRRQSQPISIFAAELRAEYKSVDQMEKGMTQR